MAINSMEHRFGLPKPDFQEPPTKKLIWPVWGIVSIVVILIVAKMGYNFYFKMVDQKNPIPDAEAANNRPATHQRRDASRSSAAQVTSTTKADAHIDGTVHQSVGDGEAFEPKKNNKIQKSIQATQKKLAAKQNKPLVRPGTYQALKAPQGIYHLVVVNHLDKDSAMQVVQQLMKKKLGVCLILPRIDKGEKYYRVTIGHSKTRYEADRKLEQFKGIYKNIFIFKY